MSGFACRARSLRPGTAVSGNKTGRRGLVDVEVYPRRGVSRSNPRAGVNRAGIRGGSFSWDGVHGDPGLRRQNGRLRGSANESFGVSPLSLDEGLASSRGEFFRAPMMNDGWSHETERGSTKRSPAGCGCSTRCRYPFFCSETRRFPAAVFPILTCSEKPKPSVPMMMRHLAW